jgi:chromosomal replication initiation ATPase DnaA
MTKGTYETWFARSQAVPGTSTPFRLTVSVTNWMAQDWLTHRLYRVIQRALSAQAGYRMDVTFVVRE